MDWHTVLGTLAPAILALVPGGAAFAPLLVAGMHIAEETKGPANETPAEKSARKKQVATDIAVTGANTANAIAKKVVVDPNQVQQAASDTVDLVITAVNNAHSQAK